MDGCHSSFKGLKWWWRVVSLVKGKKKKNILFAEFITNR